MNNKETNHEKKAKEKDRMEIVADKETATERIAYSRRSTKEGKDQ